MKLELLLEREPFKEIFIDTVSEYLKAQHGWNGNIAFSPKKHKVGCQLLANEKLNFIAPENISTTELGILAAEYASSPSPIRRLLQFLFVKFATSRLMRHFAADFYITIEPWPAVFQNWCILPGNHSLRIVDIGQDECIVLGKAGFSRNSIKNEIKIRSEHQYLPVPELLESDIEQTWYRERRISGLPINRVKASTKSAATINAAKKALQQLYDSTSKLVPISSWVAENLDHIEHKIAALPNIYDLEIRKKIRGTAKQLAAQLMSEKDGNENVDTALTHGDFQPANILMPAFEPLEPVYLIDWEYAQRRCRWYDALVLDLDSRFPTGLGLRVCSWLENDEAQTNTLDWCFTKSHAKLSARDQMRVFLLDEIIFRLDDCMIPEQKQIGSGLKIFVDALDSIRSGLL